MMPDLSVFGVPVLAAYFLILVILGIYGWHRYYLVYLYTKNRGQAPNPALPPPP